MPWPYFQISWRSKVLGVRTLVTYLSEGHNSTYNRDPGDESTSSPVKSAAWGRRPRTPETGGGVSVLWLLLPGSPENIYPSLSLVGRAYLCLQESRLMCIFHKLSFGLANKKIMSDVCSLQPAESCWKDKLYCCSMEPIKALSTWTCSASRPSATTWLAVLPRTSYFPSLSLSVSTCNIDVIAVQKVSCWQSDIRGAKVFWRLFCIKVKHPCDHSSPILNAPVKWGIVCQFAVYSCCLNVNVRVHSHLGPAFYRKPNSGRISLWRFHWRRTCSFGRPKCSE